MSSASLPSSVIRKKNIKVLEKDDENEESPVKHMVEKKEIKKKRRKKVAGHIHLTANAEPKAPNVSGDLDPAILNECKEKMRPVRKALKALDNPDQSLSEAEQLRHTRVCLLQIGEQINVCLKDYSDPKTIKESRRSNLWYFVSKFTEFDSKKLYKLYQQACKKSDTLNKKKEESNASRAKVKTKVKEEKESSSKRRHDIKYKENKESKHYSEKKEKRKTEKDKKKSVKHKRRDFNGPDKRSPEGKMD